MEKNFLASKTIQGIFITVLPIILPLIGISFSAEDGAMLSQNIDAIISALGAIYAFYGRMKATVDIKLL